MKRWIENNPGKAIALYFTCFTVGVILVALSIPSPLDIEYLTIYPPLYAMYTIIPQITLRISGFVILALTAIVGHFAQKTLWRVIK